MDHASAWTLVISCSVSAAALHRFTPWLSIRLLDQPNHRSSHVTPTPRGGGVVFVAIASFTALVSLGANAGVITYLPLFAVPLAVVGWVDDCLDLPAYLRLFVQFATGWVLVSQSPLSHSLFSCIALIILAVSVINFSNFMDGLDGLVAGCMAVIIPAIAIFIEASWPVWALVGSLLGFLFWNWNPAKVFMGDVGSTFLGAVFAGLVLQTTSALDTFSCLLVATPLLGDACFCVLRRSLAGQRIFQPHRLHLFQRLHQAGWSHPRVSLTYIVATSVLAVALLAGGWPWVFGLAAAELLFGVWLDQRVAVRFALASKS